MPPKLEMPYDSTSADLRTQGVPGPWAVPFSTLFPNLTDFIVDEIVERPLSSECWEDRVGFIWRLVRMSEELIKAIERLEEDIVFGRRRPRERLVEEDLVALLGAKKHVIRHALIELERMGLVERKRNKGAVVRDFTPEEVRQIFAVRELLEAEAARQIPLPAPPEVIESLRAIYEQHREAVETGNLHTAFRANIRFHQTLFRACGNPYLAEAINTYAFKAHGVRSYALANPDLLGQARNEHREIIEALNTGNRDRLIQLCVDHLKPTVRAYIEAYDRTFGPVLQRTA